MKLLLSVLLFLMCGITLAFAQGNLRFSYTVTTVGSTSTIDVYVQNSGSGTENMASYTMNIYHNSSESVITTYDVSPSSALWGGFALPSSTFFNSASNSAIPITHDGFGNINVLDFFGLGFDFGATPTLLLTITADNSPGSSSAGEFYLSSSSENHPEQVYNDNVMPIPMAYPVIIIPNNPAPKITGATEYCEGTGGVLLDAGAGFSSYLWSTGETTQTITALAGTYTVTVTDGTGGSGTSDGFTVTENPAPTPAISGNSDYCAGTGGVSLDAGAGFSSYLWSPGNETTQTITATAGSYSVTVTDANGCSGTSAAFVVTENPNPTPVISGQSEYCAGSDVSLDAGAGFNSYLWSPGNETTQTITATAGSYSVTVTDANGCSGTSAAFVVTENPNPTPVISGQSEYCAGSDVSLDAGAGFNSYLWSPGNETTQTITATAGSYSVTVIDANGCSGTSAAFVVTENPNPTPVISGQSEYCAGSDVTLDAGAGFNSYLWSPGNETTQTITATAGSYTVTVTDANGCSGTSAAFVVTENANPSPSISGPTEYCPGGSGVSLDAGAGFSSYFWSPGNETTQTITATAGSYSVTVTDANGCSETSPLVIVSAVDNVDPVPDVDPLPALSDPVSVTLVAPTATDNCAGTITGTTSSPLTITTPGSTIVTWTYDDGNGNSVTQQQQVSITGIPGPTFTASGTDETCDSEDDGSIEVTASGGSGNYEYSNDNGANWIGGSNPYTFTDLNGGSYQVQVRNAGDPSSASAAQTITIGNGGQPSFVASTLDASCSENEDGSIDVTASGTAPFTFSINSGAFNIGNQGPTMTTFTDLAAGDYLIQVQDANGCLSPANVVTTGAVSPPSFDVNVTHASSPSANDGSITVTVTQGTAPFQFSKDGGSTFVVGTGNSYTFSGLAIGLYDLKVKDANDCPSARVPAFVSGSNFCPSPNQIDVLFAAHPTNEAKDAKFICEDLIPMLTYNVAGITPGTSMYFDWQISDIQGKKNGHYPTYNGSVPATDGSVGGTEGPVFANGDHLFDMDGGVVGVQDLAYDEKRISISVLPYFVNTDGSACPANPDVWKIYVYPRAEAALDNANAPGTGIVLNSGDDPSGVIEIDHAGKINETNGLFVYDLHIDPNPDITELIAGLDQIDVGAITANSTDKEFDAIDLGLTSLTNTSNGAVTVTVEVTPKYDPDHARAASKDPITNPNGYCVGDMETIDITVLPASQSRKRNTLSVNGNDVLFRLYPVPSYDHLFLQASETLTEDQPYQVINMLGQHLQSGVIEAGSHRTKIFTENFSEGVYMVRFLNPTGKDVVIKFEKR